MLYPKKYGKDTQLKYKLGLLSSNCNPNFHTACTQQNVQMRFSNDHNPKIPSNRDTECLVSIFYLTFLEFVTPCLPRSTRFIDQIPPQLGGIMVKNFGVATKDGLVAGLDRDKLRRVLASFSLASISDWVSTRCCRVLSSQVVVLR